MDRTDTVSKDARDQTPMVVAAAFCHGAVQLLLNVSEVESNSRSLCGRTPLRLVATCEYEAAPRTLVAVPNPEAHYEDGLGCFANNIDD